MAATCPTGFDVTRLWNAVEKTYDRVARNPQTSFHFNMGADYAVNLLCYQRSELDRLPKRATARFHGVGIPHRIGAVLEGETVVDIGSGGGMDLLIAARRVGETGRAIGIDPTPAMREAAVESARELGIDNRVLILEGTSEQI